MKKKSIRNNNTKKLQKYKKCETNKKQNTKKTCKKNTEIKNRKIPKNIEIP